MTHAVLLLGRDAGELAALLDAEPDLVVTVADSAREARRCYSGQPILCGDPATIAQVLEGMTGVEWVQSTWAGVMPLTALGRRDYVLTGVKGVFGPQMSEYVTGHLLARELRIANRLEAQQQHRWYAEPSGTLHGKRMGVMGTGSIGRAIARRAAGFGVTVTGLNTTGQAVEEFVEVYPAAQLAEFLADLDYLVSALPATSATDELLNATTLAALPAHAVFVNVGRANVVDDDALLHALRGGRLGGAILDVFDEEPLAADSPLWEAPNLVVTGHIAAISHPQLIAPVFLENYRRFRSGSELLHVVDFERGY